jgi:hypothetical protein
MKTLYPWQDSFLAAILETDDKSLPDRMRAAQQAIAHRRNELHSNGRRTSDEWHALEKALAELEVLWRERVKAPSESTCRICGKSVLHEESKTDGNGAAVHEVCYVRELLAAPARARDGNS